VANLRCLHAFLLFSSLAGCGGAARHVSTEAASPAAILPAAVASPPPSAEAPHDTCEIPAYDVPARIPQAPEAPLSGAVARTCRALQSQSRRLLRTGMPPSWRALERELRAEDEESDDSRDPPSADLAAIRGALGRCSAAGSGAWAFEPLREAFVADEEDGEFVYQVSVRLVYVDLRGATVHGVEQSLSLDAFSDAVSMPSLPQAIFDFDGDGRFEATWFNEQGQQVELVTATSTQVDVVPLPSGVLIEGWVDADHDARPDILMFGPYTQAECYESSVAWSMPSLVAHSTEGLAFSSTDAVAASFAREICPCAPSELLARDAASGDAPLYAASTLVHIACARLWGASSEEIEARLEVELAPLGEEDGIGDVCAHSLETLASFAAHEPPLLLRPPTER
jgi:hypothetical protein